ncbi:hypothetical protein CWI38_1467p0030 [Hamiltosporidium tvaerminnensis]|uniref:Uncharacterized protein n=1 Tax=Hamiltosporidium tvaerminnensis TaxID=1176355 RepID=A0A4Q9LTL2_9MICR|nr:hypothetical protein CWI38_1467p0030 [Hamiltosporidium tvaerminnensis]
MDTQIKEYHAEVQQLFSRSGPGGALTLCHLKLLDTGRIRVGDIITLLDCEREHKRGRY